MDEQTAPRISNYQYLEIIYLFIVPVVLIYFNIIPIEWRAIVLMVVSIIIFRIMRHGKWTREMMGLAHTARVPALIVYGIATVLGVVLIKRYAQSVGFAPLDLSDLSQSWQLLLFFIPLSVLQEVAYRGFLVQRLKEFSFAKWQRIAMNAALFTLLHIIYPFPHIMLPLAFVGGVIFAVLYEKYPDLLLICVMHAAVNFTAVLFGFFTP